MKVCILTEGGRDIGFGHITRCLSLCQAFEANKISARFIINGDEAVKDLLKGRDVEIFDWLKDSERLDDLLEETDIAVVDSYLAGLALYKRIQERAKMAVYIDDNKRIDYPKGVVLNGTVNADKKNFFKEEGITHLLGSRYTPLRRDFWEAPDKEIREIVKSAVITFGGDDSRNITPKVLSLLTKNYPELTKRVIVGKGFKSLDEINEAKDENTRLIYHPEANQMKKVLLESDIAISAGGQTLYEAARIGLPAIAIAVAENQLDNVRGWLEAGFIEYAGWWEEKGLEENLLKAIERLQKKDVRLKMSSVGRKFVDGKGSLRVVEALLNTGHPGGLRLRN
ncbi:MAG: UDP-2,4-diacetamido-2,4,6-trideoxy-beta-L-altropyranose hydrolase [Candidatus Omnitrophica bacterium]|nr:UDP-2,4-diacetamido-2,4,6-trideoxy-beta-L-altropyranose hydrolase [Candidatus Omnitrophota bacterium]